MQNYQIRRVALVVVAVIAIVFIVSQVASLFRRATTDDTNDTTQATTQIGGALIDYADQDSSVQLTYDGPIVAREDHRSIRVTVTADTRRIEVLQGYSGSALIRREFKNDENAYAVFLRAIDYEGFASDQKNKLGDDERGICPSGKRTIVELRNGGESQLRLWSASCDKDAGTLAGSSRNLLKLFQDQIPNYRDVTDNIRL